MRIVVLILFFAIGWYTVPALSETTDEKIRKDSEETWTLLEMEIINAEGKKMNVSSVLDWGLGNSPSVKSILIDRKCWEILEIAYFEYIEQGVPKFTSFKCSHYDKDYVVIDSSQLSIKKRCEHIIWDIDNEDKHDVFVAKRCKELEILRHDDPWEFHRNKRK